MTRYHRNNIAFRISSADAISKFKSAQMHAFFQLVRKDIGFNDSAKEAVLLEFDRFSDWIFRAERICVAMDSKFSEQILKSFHSSVLDEQVTIESVMQRYSNVFSMNVVKFTKLIHQYSNPILLDRIMQLDNQDIDAGFVKLVSIMGDYLQHFLVCMHEFNNNLIIKKSAPFLSVADFCISIDYESMCEFPCAKRAQFFMENGVGDTYVLKNYSNTDVFQKLKDALVDKNIHLIPENNDQLESA